jgi:enamine deaminase RidA (YjgF/YER057c/UK114 family)
MQPPGPSISRWPAAAAAAISGPEIAVEESMSTITRVGCGARMSDAVIHSGLVYLSGQVGTPGASVTQQTQEILAGIDRLLASAGADKTRILSAQIWLADIADFAEMNAVWDAWVPQGDCPARATGESKLAAPGYRVEIIVVAAQR